LGLLKTIRFLFCLLLINQLHAQHYLEFTENKGQWDAAVRFKAELSNGAFILTNTGYRLGLYNKEDIAQLSSRIHSHAAENNTLVKQTTSKGNGQSGTEIPDDINQLTNGRINLRGHIYEMRFLHANQRPEIVPDKALPTLSNYFIGNDSTKWGNNCRTFNAVTYRNVYPNIDVRYYTVDGTLKYDLIVRPGGKLSDIALYFDGAESLKLKEGNLRIKTSVEEITEKAPYTYQIVNNSRTEIPCRFELKGNIVQFAMDGNYNPRSTIIIDPSLIFSTFTGSFADNWGYTATYDGAGNFYAGGIVFSGSNGFPVSNGAFQQTYQGGSSATGERGGFDMAIIKFDATGANRLYATYLGGGSGNEQPHSMVADASGNLVIAGRTTSTDYPTRGALGTYGPLGGGWDIFVTKLNNTGTALIGSVRIGGRGDDGVNIKHKYSSLGAESINRNYGDDARSEVILDAAGNVLFASCTQSTNFPVTAVSAQNTTGGANAKGRSQDAVIMKLSPDLSAVLFSVLFGGNDDDAAFVLAINPSSGNIFVGGATASGNFPGDKTGAKYNTFQGGTADGFITEFTPAGSMVRSSFWGTSGIDIIYGLQFDKFGLLYIGGTSTGSWPVVNAAFSQSAGRQFISKLKPDLSDFIYSTVFGTGAANPNISPTAFLVDRCENVYVSGWGGSANSNDGFPNAGTRGLTITPDAYQKTTDNDDFYFFVLEKNAKSQLYGSFFGQDGGYGEHVDGGTSRFDRNGVIYQSICANCGNKVVNGRFINFPTTPGVWSSTNNSSDCNLAAIKIAFNLAGIGSGILTSVNGRLRDTAGCVPVTVDFRDTIAMGKKYIWDFNDGSPSETTTNPTSTHTFNTIGLYRVRLVAIDSSTCNIADTTYITMRVRDDKAALAFTATKQPPCTALTYVFNNSSAATKPFKNNSFRWDFGDGTTQLAGLGPVTHTYAASGTYNVRLVLVDTNYCNEPDSLVRQIRLSPNVKAQFETPATGCAPYTAVFNNTSLGGASFIWDFGDGSSSTQTDPTHLYSNPGTYRVRLIAVDPNTCNGRDTSAYFTITVSPHPVSSYTYSPNPTEANAPVSFQQTAIGATRFFWLFGDGTNRDVTKTDTVQYLYNGSGTYNACLLVYNSTGCADTSCQPITVTITSLLDVANAFTPNGDGKNDKVFVRGFGIQKMTWTIYNRWGTVVYQGTDPNEGWDGTYKGQPQPQDVYQYTLVVEFSSKERTTKKGDITLLR
jgi:gliding motility-associated-like protein